MDSITTLRCKKCKDLFHSNYLKNHYCYKIDINTSKKESFSIDRQCCVLEENIPCTNSILCKIHSLEQKSKIEGRLYPVQLLIDIVKKENQKKKENLNYISEKYDENELKKAFKVIENLKPVFILEKKDNEFKEFLLKMSELNIPFENKPEEKISGSKRNFL